MTSGRSLHRPFTSTYIQAEAYVAKNGAGGPEAVRLSALIAAHEDVQQLQKDEPSFAWHVMRTAEAEDEPGLGNSPPPQAEEKPRAVELVSLDDTSCMDVIADAPLEEETYLF